jgi:RHS repeat-associated protein
MKKDPFGADPEYTSKAYYEDPADPGRYGRVQSEQRHDGSWIMYDYDKQGRLILEKSPWLNASFGSVDTNAIVVHYAYTTLDANETPRLGDPRWRTRTRKVTGIPVKTDFRAFFIDPITGEKVMVEESAASPGNQYGNSSNHRKETRKFWLNAGSVIQDRLSVVIHTDGKQTHYTYHEGLYHQNTNGLGSFTGSQGLYVKVTETHDALNIQEGRSTRNVRILDDMNRLLQEQTEVFNGSAYEIMDWTCTQRDEEGRETQVWYANGLSRDITWNCCGKESERFPDGRVEFYEHDALNRTVRRTMAGTSSGNWPAQTERATEYDYDAAGNLIQQREIGGALSLTTTNAYDLAGRRIHSTSPDGLVTAWYYDANEVLQVAPGGVVSVKGHFYDGRIAYHGGAGHISRYYTYGVDTNGQQWTRIHTESPTSAVWQLEVFGNDGHIARNERPGFGGVVIATEYEYNEAGSLIRVKETGRPDQILEYDDHGQLFRRGHDVDGNGHLDLGSIDRIADQLERFVKDGTSWYRQVDFMTYPNDGDNLVVTTRITRATVGGTGCSCAGGHTEEHVAGGMSTYRDALFFPAEKTTMKLLNRSDSGAEGTEVIVNGLVQRVTDLYEIETTFLHDDLGRVIARIDQRMGTNRTHYAANGRVEWVEDAAGYRTLFTYDGQTGLRTAVTDAASNTIYTAYDAMRRVTNTWGATYPVAYTYDQYGRMTAMKTWRSVGDAPDETRWHYEEATGLLTNKQYADGNGVAYSYDGSGRLTSRVWARGVSTSYAYDSMGNLTNIVYSDGTPSVSFIYDRLGRRRDLVDGTGSRGYAYDHVMRLIGETNWLGTMSRSYDAIGRANRIEVDSSLAYGYAYDAWGRLSSVTSTVYDAVTQRTAHSYAYLAGSDLIKSVSNHHHGVTSFGYEPHRPWQTSVIHAVSGVVASRYDYHYDGVGRRTRRVDDDVVTNQFAYNLRSELADAAMGTNSFGYAYDAIGNREVATNNGVVTVYGANALNQYTNISTAPASPVYDLDGNMMYDGTWGYAWDGENRLVGLSPAVTNAGAKRLGFGYDFMSRRVWKAVEVWDGASWSTTVTVTYVYDDWNLVAERRSDESFTRFYVWGLDLSGTLQGAGGIGGLLVGLKTDLPADQAYYLADANGNITTLLATNGSSQASYTYDPFGNPITATGPLAQDNPFRFSSKYTDGESGLVYYGYRFYSAEMGRWINRDPIEERGGVNLYQFAQNNSCNKIDVLGLECCGGVTVGPGTGMRCCGGQPYLIATRGCCDNTTIFYPETECCLGEGKLGTRVKRKDCPGAIGYCWCNTTYVGPGAVGSAVGGGAALVCGASGGVGLIAGIVGGVLGEGWCEDLVCCEK